MSIIIAVRQAMLVQAIDTLLWTELTEHGEPLDTLYGHEHVSMALMMELGRDIFNFVNLIIDLEDEEMSNSAWALLKNDPEQAGHDFILSRNGHGTGFWDRGNGDVGDELHKWAKTFGEINVGVGDDGFLYN